MNVEGNTEHEDASLYFLGLESFDTLSEIGGSTGYPVFSPKSEPGDYSPIKLGNGSAASKAETPESYRIPSQPRYTEKEENHTDMKCESIGNGSSSRSIASQLEQSKRDYMAHYEDPHRLASNDWQYHHRQYGSTHHSTPSLSNPRFVLRSAAKAFSTCSYRLSCMSEAGICPVNLSRFGNFHHYQEVRTLSKSSEMIDS